MKVSVIVIEGRLILPNRKNFANGRESHTHTHRKFPLSPLVSILLLQNGNILYFSSPRCALKSFSGLIFAHSSRVDAQTAATAAAVRVDDGARVHAVRVCRRVGGGACASRTYPPVMGGNRGDTGVVTSLDHS